MEELIYCKFANDRKKNFAIKTYITEDNGVKAVYKEAIYDEGVAHLKRMYELSNKIQEEFEDSCILINKAENYSNPLKFPYVCGENLEERLDKILIEHGEKKLIEEIDRYLSFVYKTLDKIDFEKTEEFSKCFGKVELINKYRCGYVTNIDMLCKNVIVNDSINIIDNEWIFDFPIPREFVIYRIIFLYFCTNPKRLDVNYNFLYEKYGISKDDIEIFKQMEINFQNYTGNNRLMGKIYNKITPGYEIIEAKNDNSNIEIQFLLNNQIVASVRRSVFSKYVNFNVNQKFNKINIISTDSNIYINVIDIIINDNKVSTKEEGVFYLKKGENRIIKDGTFEYEGLVRITYNILRKTPTVENIIEDIRFKYNTTILYKDSVISSIENTITWKIRSAIKNKSIKHLNSKKRDSKGKTIVNNIDTCYIIPNNGIYIAGWCLNVKDIQLIDSNDNVVNDEVKILRVVRQDVNEALDIDDKNEKLGFIAFTKSTNVEKIKYTLSDERISIEPIDFNKSNNIMSKKETLKKVIKSLTQNGIKKTISKCKNKVKSSKVNIGDATIPYEVYSLLMEPSKEELEAQKNYEFKYNPKMSIVVPLYKSDIDLLRELIRSIQDQTYGNWELCFSDGTGSKTELSEFLEKESREDNRIKYLESDVQLGISDNTNNALTLATGEYIVFSDHDDLLTPDALFECVKAINEHENVDIIYSDEDKITEDGSHRCMPHFKSDFNLDLLCTNNYFCHLFVVKASIQKKVGLLNKEFDGAQDYDFNIRCVEASKNIYHIPKVLYHWRMIPGSTALEISEKSYAVDAGRRAVQAYYNRNNIDATVSILDGSPYLKTTYHLKATPKVSIIIPNKDHTDDLDRCIKSILEKSTYANYEIIVVENNSEKDETFNYYKNIDDNRVKVIYYKEKGFNYSKLNNFGVENCDGEYLLFLNNDTEVINSNWIEELLGYCSRKDVGIVGARLYYPDNTVQHGGVIIGLGGVAGHTFVNCERKDGGYFYRGLLAQDLNAVTAACMMTKRSVFNEVNGFFDGLAVAFNDVDFCLKVRKAGYLIVYNPSVELYHYESKSRGIEDTPEKIARFNGEVETILGRWPEIKDGDCYYNKNLSRYSSDYSIVSVREINNN